MAAATAGRGEASKRGTARGRSAAAGSASRRGGPQQWTRVRDGQEIRWARVLSAQARIAEHYYERDDVKEFLVDAVLEELTSH